MKGLKWIVFALSLVATAPATAWDRDVPAALRPYMTAEEFRAAGLHKLNPVELAQFQAWFVRTMRDKPAAPANASATAPATAPTQPSAGRPVPPALADDDNGSFGLETMPDRVGEIVATAAGTFEGWERGTRFELDNGQVWEVYDTPRFRFLSPLTDPTVSIERGAFDTYRLKIEGYNRWANVRRIR